MSFTLANSETAQTCQMCYHDITTTYSMLQWMVMMMMMPAWQRLLLGRLHQETAPLELLSQVETTFSCVSPSPWAATGWNARCFVYTISKGAGALISIKTVIELNYLYDCPLELLSMLFSSPRKKSMWGEYNAGSPDTTKGHCIRKPYLCCVTFGCAGEVGWIPADTQSAPVRGTEWILNVWFEVPTSARPRQMAPYCFPYYAFECSARVVEAPNSAWTCVSNPGCDWDVNSRQHGMLRLHCSTYCVCWVWAHC